VEILNWNCSFLSIGAANFHDCVERVKRISHIAWIRRHAFIRVTENGVNAI
jgi:hypothetical protein